MSAYKSVDIDEILKDEERFGKKSRAPRIKINPGEEKVVRLLKAPQDTKFYVIRVQHWGIPIGMGKTPPQICTWKHSGEPCYYCEVVNEYYNSGDPRKAELARRMKASITYVSNVIDVNDPTNDDGTPKVQIWQYSQSVYKELLYYFKHRDEYGDLTHPEEGRDIRIKAEIMGQQTGRTYTRHAVKVRGNASAIPDMAALDHLHDLETMYPLALHSYEVQQGIFEGTLDYRTGKAKNELGGRSPMPELEAGDSFESFSAEKPKAKKASKKDDDWDDLEDDSEEDEKVRDIKAKLRSTLNKKKG